MPKLSQQTLEKRFQCPYCGETKRTRQGLSGHIQFKHYVVQNVVQADAVKKRPIDPLVEMKILDRRQSQSQGITQEEYEEMIEIRADWFFIEAFMRHENITLTDNDYKTYLFIATAFMYGNQRLMNKINKKIGPAIEQLREISANMSSKS